MKYWTHDEHKELEVPGHVLVRTYEGAGVGINRHPAPEVRRNPRRVPRRWDISPPVEAGAPVFPGDTPYQQQWAASIAPGCPVNVSTLTLSPHVGAHADAPLHYDPQGSAVGALDLQPYLGPCRVIHAIARGPLVTWEHIAHAVRDLPPRVLVRTYHPAPVDRSAWQLAA